jgi:hypothetical protein
MTDEPDPAHRGDRGPWLEIYDGTVDPHQLARWLGALSVLGLAVFLGASALFGAIADAEIARGYALLVGLAAVVAGAAVSATRVRPKRIVTEDRLDAAAVEAAARDLSAVAGGSLDARTAPAAVIEEMRRAGLEQLLLVDQAGRQPVVVPGKAGGEQSSA